MEKKSAEGLPSDATPSSETEAFEEKRIAARRRFLSRGAAAGAVLTFLHERSVAGGTSKILVSSAATCTSLHGTAGKTVQVWDSVQKTTKVNRTECFK